MPITTFNSFSDGLDPSRRSREDLSTNVNIEDDRYWVPYGDGVWIQPCLFNLTSGGFSIFLKGLPGGVLGKHHHVGSVHGYTSHGHWRYLEHDWVAKPGSFVYEAPGAIHTLIIPQDSPEPVLAVFVIEGAVIFLDNPVKGSDAREDGFTLLELTRKYYREAGLDVHKLDLLIR
jgi:hypothetical protein